MEVRWRTSRHCTAGQLDFVRGTKCQEIRAQYARPRAVRIHLSSFTVPKRSSEALVELRQLLASTSLVAIGSPRLYSDGSFSTAPPSIVSARFYCVACANGSIIALHTQILHMRQVLAAREVSKTCISSMNSIQNRYKWRQKVVRK